MLRFMRRSLLASLIVVAILGALARTEADPRRVKVLLEFRRSGTSETADLGGGGSVVIRRREPRVRGSVGGGLTTTETRRSTGIFTIVDDGGSSMLSVGSRVPYEETVFYRDYATGAGYVVRSFGFENLGTALHVHARILDDERIRLRLVPTIRDLATDGTIEFTEAATELTVESGRSVSFGGSSHETADVTRRILGIASRTGREETRLAVTATLDPSFP